MSILRACGGIAQTSLVHQISDNSSTDILVGSDLKVPQEVVSRPTLDVGQGLELYKLGSAGIKNRDKLIGASISFADLGLSTAEQGLVLTGLNLPNGTNTVFKTTAWLISGVDLYHSLTKDDADAIEIAISSISAIAATADLVAPFVPFLRSYQPHLGFITTLLKTTGAGKKVFALTYQAGN
jgi:hypothetical protein